MTRRYGRILLPSTALTALSAPVWASTQIPEPAGIGGAVLGIGVAALIVMLQRRK